MWVPQDSKKPKHFSLAKDVIKIGKASSTDIPAVLTVTMEEAGIEVKMSKSHHNEPNMPKSLDEVKMSKSSNKFLKLSDISNSGGTSYWEKLSFWEKVIFCLPRLRFFRIYPLGFELVFLFQWTRKTLLTIYLIR